jgi:5-methylcytosine-specific restriction endonuclease McrA
MSWVDHLHKICPIVRIDCELVRFDMQLLENSEISGAEYQRGELAGYEVKEYLLEKWGRACVYCGKEGVPLQREHIQAKARSGSNRISNLTLSCEPCNQTKGAQPIEVFLKKKPALLTRILATAKKPLRDAAAVNSTRWALVKALQETGIQAKTYSGGRTKWNRCRLGIPKTHALDAVCVGVIEKIGTWRLPTLHIKSMGRGSYQRTRVTSYGLPRGYLTRQKRIFGFQTGDMVRAVVVKGKKVGTYTGRVAVRATGCFNIQTSVGVVEGISHNNCRLLTRGDGYSYAVRTTPLHTLKNVGSASLEIR